MVPRISAPGPIPSPPVTSSSPLEHQTRASRRADRARRRGDDHTVGTTGPHPAVVASAVVTALALAGVAATGERLFEVIAVVITGLVVSAGWPRLVGSPTPAGSSVVLGVTTVVLGVALFAQGEEPFLEQAPAAVAAGVIAMCLHPLVQESARPDLARSIVGTALGVLVIACGGVLTSTISYGSGNPIVVAGIALAVAALVDLVTERPGREVWMVPVAMVVGGGVGLLVQWLVHGEAAAWPALVGVLSAGTAVCLRRVVSQHPAVDGTSAAVAAGAASVLVVGPLLHLVSRLPVV